MKLRKLKPEDAPGMLSWMHDPQTSALFAADFAHFTQEDALRFIEHAQTERPDLHLACVNDADVYLGTISLKHIDARARNAEYAVSFCTHARGTGAAAFATREILKLAFEQLGLERVYLNVIAENLRANHFYQKMGFVYEGCFKRHILVGGCLHDLNWYRMLREEYQNMNPEERT